MWGKIRWYTYKSYEIKDTIKRLSDGKPKNEKNYR